MTGYIGNCDSCERIAHDDDLRQCDSCERYFHEDCTGWKETETGWACEDCLEEE